MTRSTVRIPNEFIEMQERVVRDKMLDVLFAMGAERDIYTEEWLVAVDDMPRFLGAPSGKLPP
jgi:hypothetical protein